MIGTTGANGCSHEANLLLPWLVNGTLREDEAEMAIRHLRDCVTCAEEVEALREISDGIEVHGIPAEAGGAIAAAARPGRRAIWLAAASLLLPVMAALYWLGAGPGRGAPAAPDYLIDLGAGPVRAVYEMPELAVPAQGGTVTVRLLVPVFPGARDRFILYGPDGAALTPERELTLRDGVGAYEFALDSASLSAPGEYRIQVRSTTPTGDQRLFDYLFRIRLPALP